MQGTTMTVITRRIVLGALLALTIVPFVVTGGLFFPFITGKAFLFRVLVEIGFAAYVVLATLDARYRPQRSWLLWIFAGFVGWMLVADLFAANVGKAFWSNFERMEGWVTLVHLFLLFIMASGLFEEIKRARVFWLVSLAVSGIICVYGFLQISGLININQGSVRIDATFGNATYLAAYLLFHLFIAAWRFVEERGVLRYAMVVLIFLQGAALYFTATRGAVLGVVLGIVVSTALFLARGDRKIRTRALLVLFALTLSLGALFGFRDSAWVKNSPPLARLTSVSLSDGTTRFGIWNIALKGAIERPVFGWGQEGFNYVFNKYYSPSLYAQETWFDRAHNVYLDWLIAGGVPALLLYLGLFYFALRALWKGRFSFREKAIFTGLLVAYAVHSIFVFDNTTSYLLFVAVLATIHAQSPQGAPALSEKQKPTTPTLSLSVPAIVGASLIAVLLFVNVPSYLAARDLLQALKTPGATAEAKQAAFKKALDDDAPVGRQEIREQLVQAASTVVASSGVSDAQKGAFVIFAKDEMFDEVQRNPNDARLRLMLENVYRLQGDYTKALEQINAALELSPQKQQVLFEGGTLALDRGDIQTALTFFETAYHLDERYDDAAIFLAIGKILARDNVGAKALLYEHFNSEVVDSEIIARAYYQAGNLDDFVKTWEYRREVHAEESSFWYSLASAYYTAGRIADARATVVAAMDRFPETVAQGNAYLSEIDARK